jgi:poly-gamma-glutamate capsule biosynthesis protein CapA/YwtB (metallophosphatase superfamily)
MRYFSLKSYFPFFFLFLFFFGKNLSAQTPSDSISKINLLFVGDIMGHDPQIESAEITKNESYNYEPCFQYIKPIIEKADLAIANLEVTLPGKPPYRGYPQFRSPNELALALRLAGFDLLVTANNHSNDAGKKGVINTISTVKDYGFYQTGTFKNQEDRDLYYPLIVYKNDFKIAFLNYTYGTNGIKTRPPVIVNYIDEKLIEADLKLAHELKPDAIIVITHWGKEYKYIENEKQRKLAKKIFNWGADLIIGMHPHVVQPIREMKILQQDSTFKKTLVIYSLGNFISGQTTPNTEGGFMFEVTLEKDKKTNKVTLGEHHYIPVWRYVYQDSKKKSTYFALPISPFENGNGAWIGMDEENKKNLQAFAKKTRGHLKDSHSSERIITLKELGDVPKLKLVKKGIKKAKSTKKVKVQK